VDDAAQQVKAVLLPAAAVAGLASAARPHLGLDPLEILLGDQRLVASLGLDPFLGRAPDQRSLSLFGGTEVEPVPVEAPGVDGVLQHRADRRL
jgi:hypothetical protein